MDKILRLSEYKTLLYRIFLAYLFYTIARILFFAFNSELFETKNMAEIINLCYYGLAFDTTAIIYTNSLFILLSVLPTMINSSIRYQKYLKIFYFVTNFIALLTNFIDIIYYRFSQTRSTISSLDLLVNEHNKNALLFHFVAVYWYIILIFISCCLLWVWLYSKQKIQHYQPAKAFVYFSSSALCLLLVATLAVGGIRGDFKHSTRPINLVDAYKHVKITNQGDIVLNTPFSIIRTLNSNQYKIKNWVSESYITENIKPEKLYTTPNPNKPNIVVFILESMAREYWGSMNRASGIPNFNSYTPFLDSLSNESLIFTNAFANGRQSIHAMSSVLAGIPSFQTAFTSSPFAKQQIQSLVSVTNAMSYHTSFYHGAANGSMGFLGFANILGFDHYYGKTEYNNDADYDGIWGIWDEPFMQYMAKNLSHTKQPFLATLFSLSSHDPFKIPKKYTERFKDGNIPIHKCVLYTDNALRNYFNYAKTQPWYKNTIFVITADHTNQPYYQEFAKPINRFAVPILFFSPNQQYHLKGIRKDLASQLDIYPTLVDLTGFNKPFRSWGRSLITNQASEIPRVINSPGNVYQFMQGNYNYIFDGKEFTGIFDINDKGLEKNLIKNKNTEMQKGMMDCKAFLQDYMERIVNRKLNTTK